MEFWANQRRAYPEQKLVVILEDSDAALMTRASDNREQVSAILNLSDGMLGDFLRLQIICTINCTAADIDPALLRPGRLLQHRIFARLSPGEAGRLAQALGRTLPVARDYSLAEVFAGDEAHEARHPQIGFAA
jgi:ATP-dependent 26S proteasome regulatory subunit